MYFRTTFIFILIFCQYVSSQVKVWDMNACMQYAIKHNTDIQIKEIENRNLAIDKKQSIKSFLPSISGSVGLNSSYGLSIDPQTNSYSNISHLSNNYSVSGQMDLFRSGYLRHQLKKDNIRVRIGKCSQQQQQDDIAIQVMDAYCSHLYALRKRELAYEKLERSHQLLKTTAHKEKLGLKSEAELIQVKAEVATDDYFYTFTDNEYKHTLYVLKDIMNYPIQDSLLILTHLDVLNEQFPMKYQLTDINYRQLPEFRIAKYNAEYYRFVQKQNSASLFPTIALSGGISTRFYENLKDWGTYESMGHQLRYNFSQSVGISMHIPIFNQQRYASYKKAKNQAHISQIQQENIERKLTTKIEKDIQDYNGLVKELAQIKEKVNADQLTYQINLKKYDRGLIDLFELQTFSNRLLESKIQHLQIQMSYIIKKRLIDYYYGQPLIQQ